MSIRNWMGYGVLAGAVGLVAMEVIRRSTRRFVKKRAPRPTDVFASARSISLVGRHHHDDESATDALGRIAYEKIAGREPSARAKRALSWAVHIGYGMFVASLFDLIVRSPRHPVRAGAYFGAGLWLFGDELAGSLLGLSDRPSAYHPTQHAQSLAQHLGFGISVAAAARSFAEKTR